MYRKTVFIGSLENAISFVKASDTQEARMYLYEGTATINAKSLLGVFSLDLSKPMQLEIDGDSSQIQRAEHAVQHFILESNP